MLCLFASAGMLFTACTKENEPDGGSGEVDTKEYISMESLGKAESKFGVINYYGQESSGSHDIDLILYGGITKAEIDAMEESSAL